MPACRGERLHRTDGSHRSDGSHWWVETLFACVRCVHVLPAVILVQRRINACDME